MTLVLKKLVPHSCTRVDLCDSLETVGRKEFITVKYNFEKVLESAVKDLVDVLKEWDSEEWWKRIPPTLEVDESLDRLCGLPMPTTLHWYKEVVKPGRLRKAMIKVLLSLASATRLGPDFVEKEWEEELVQHCTVMEVASNEKGAGISGKERKGIGGSSKALSLIPAPGGLEAESDKSLTNLWFLCGGFGKVEKGEPLPVENGAVGGVLEEALGVMESEAETAENGGSGGGQLVEAVIKNGVHPPYRVYVPIQDYRKLWVVVNGTRTLVKVTVGEMLLVRGDI